MLIKTFRFRVSNWAIDKSPTTDKAHENERIIRGKSYLSGPKKIDRKINAWLETENANLIDIKITAVTTNQHNNGGSDAVDMFYAVLYEHKK
jgi:hypothetical protein